MNYWIPMTNDDWDWVNGKIPEPVKSQKLQGVFKDSLNNFYDESKTITKLDLIRYCSQRRMDSQSFCL